MPSFIVKNGPEKPPQKRGCFCCIFGFFFLNFFVFFPLFLLISCCFMLSWNPKTAHQVRLQAYIYIYRYIDMHACNLIWWAVLGFQDVMKQQETRRNKERKTKKSRKKKHNGQQKPPRFCVWPFKRLAQGPSKG